MTVSVSTNYRRLSPDEVPIVAAECDAAWKNPAIPRRQWIGVVRGELQRYREGESMPHFDVLIRALRKTGLVNPSVLEIGASSGYYSELFRIAGLEVDYAGLDYSDEYKRLAEELFPDIKFKVGDARDLPYLANSFDVAISGCCILHIADYERAIAETSRVASQFAIFNRTPVLMADETTVYEKQAYGCRVIEIHFAESELLYLFDKHGLSVVSCEDVFTEPERNYSHRTYLLKKR